MYVCVWPCVCLCDKTPKLKISSLKTQACKCLLTYSTTVTSSFIQAATCNGYLAHSQANWQSVLSNFCFINNGNTFQSENYAIWREEMNQKGQLCVTLKQFNFIPVLSCNCWYIEKSFHDFSAVLTELFHQLVYICFLMFYIFTYSFNLFLCKYKQATSLVTSLNLRNQYESDYASIDFSRSSYNMLL